MSEFKTLKNEEDKQEEEIFNTFGREPLIIKCVFCSKKVLSEIEVETTWIGILLSLVLLIIFKLLAIPLIIVLIPLTQQTLHRCPNCLNKMGTCNFYDILALSDKVLSFSIGSFAIIFSRKMLLGFFVCLLLITICIFFFSSIVFSMPNIIEDKWEDYWKFCSPDEFSKRHSQASVYCQKYRYADVAWDGYLVRVDYESSFISRYKATMLMKMNKNDTSEDGDLYLKLDDYKYSKFKNVIYNLTRGDHLYFNATILHEAGLKRNTLAEPFDLAKKEDHININPHIHHHGRYSLDDHHSLEHQPIHKNDHVYEELSDFVVDKEVDTRKQRESFK